MDIHTCCFGGITCLSFMFIWYLHIFVLKIDHVQNITAKHGIIIQQDVEDVTRQGSNHTSYDTNLCPRQICTDVGVENKLNLEAVPMREVERRVQGVRDGGSWSPQGCTPRHKVAIIIPFRDRHQQLAIMLNNIHSFLQRQNLDYRIYLIEQEEGVLFSKGSMMNIGVLEAIKSGGFECFIFHDVDMLPENDCSYYNCELSPLHLAAAINRYNYRWLENGVLTTGGAMAMSRQHFETINGFANLWYGWGQEDDHLNQRILGHNLHISRYNKEIARYTSILHKPDHGNPRAQRSPYDIRHYMGLHHLDGLNTTSYDIIKSANMPLYTWIYVHIKGPAENEDIRTFMKSQLLHLAQDNIALQEKILNYFDRRLFLRHTKDLNGMF